MQDTAVIGKSMCQPKDGELDCPLRALNEWGQRRPDEGMGTQALMTRSCQSLAFSPPRICRKSKPACSSLPPSPFDRSHRQLLFPSATRVAGIVLIPGTALHAVLMLPASGELRERAIEMCGDRWMVRAGDAAALYDKVLCHSIDAEYHLNSASEETMAASSVKTTAVAVRSSTFVIDDQIPMLVCAYDHSDGAFLWICSHRPLPLAPRRTTTSTSTPSLP
jgi:hypothetical protein